MTFLEKVVSAAETAAYVAAHGFHPLTPEQIATRLEICQTCEEFTGAGCKLCGCSCSGKQSLTNKLAHPQVSCPADPPKWGPA